MARRTHTLLSVGRQAAWRRIDARERASLAREPGESLEERLLRGQRLSVQAARLRRAIVRDPLDPRSGLRSLVSFKRLANRPRDRLDLEELRALHGELPLERLPGIDE